MEIIQNTSDRLVLLAEGNEPLLNALRRSVLEVETLAIQEVEFFKNDSALFDEVLALRVGLVPLVTDKKMSGKTEIELKLVKKGPCVVYSGDLQGNAEVVHKNIPLVLLEKDQEIEFIGTARLGKGIQHAKHTPGLCHYRHLALVDSKDSKVEQLVQQSKGYVKPKKQKDGWLCDLSEGVAEQIVQIDKDAITYTNEMVFVVESYGTMGASEILRGAAKALESNLEEFEGAFK